MSANTEQKNKKNKTPSDAFMRDERKTLVSKIVVKKVKKLPSGSPKCFLKSIIPAQNVQEGTWTVSIFKFEHQDTAEIVLESPQAKKNKNHSNSSNQQQTGSWALVKPQKRLWGKWIENQWNHWWQLDLRHLDRKQLFLSCSLKTKKKVEHWAWRFSWNKAQTNASVHSQHFTLIPLAVGSEVGK